MGTDANGPQQLGSRSDIDVAINNRCTRRAPRANRYLLEDEAIHADFCIRMDYDSIGVWDKQAATDLAKKGNIGTRNRTPKMISQHHELDNSIGQNSGPIAPILVTADRQQKFAAWIPESTDLLSVPIRHFRASFHHNSCLVRIRRLARRGDVHFRRVSRVILAPHSGWRAPPALAEVDWAAQPATLCNFGMEALAASAAIERCLADRHAGTSALHRPDRLARSGFQYPHKLSS